MYDLLRNLVKAGSLRSVVAVLSAALLSHALFAAEKEYTFRGETIYYEGAADPIAIGDQELDGEVIFVFTNSAASAVNTLRTKSKFKARVLVVGGGGAGGYGTTGSNNPGGGGGGGEVVELAESEYAAGTFSAVIGAGGEKTTTQKNGQNGSPSSLSFAGTVIANALGGGGGGAQAAGNGSKTELATGGGGGGNGKLGGEGKLHNGGKAAAAAYAGGGGGVNGNGNNSTSSKAGAGGAGLDCSSGIWADVDTSKGFARAYGGGGGGGHTSAFSSRDGAATHGGGKGGHQGVAPINGTANTGGGGGGGGKGTTSNLAYNGGAGGSGVVIVRITWLKKNLNYIPIEVVAAGGKGTIFVANHASTKWLNGDLIITYAVGEGGLCFKDPNNRPEYAKLPPVWANAQVLAIGGGGGGGMIATQGNGGGAGGGAGGFVEKTGLVFDNTVEYSVIVGKGGVGGAAHEAMGESGTSSSLTTNEVNLVDEAFGGGGGGAHSTGLDGGSGGGGSLQGAQERQGGSGVGGQGFKGGDGTTGYYVGAGGGGAGGAGGNAVLKIDGINYAGEGGIGRSSSITGSSLMYAGGGGGGYLNQSDLQYPHPGAAGGDGGGGKGAGVENGVAVPAEDGLDGFGGGGGGGISRVGASETAGKGGDGVVIIRLSGWVVSSIPVPVSPAPYTYDGAAHVGVESLFYWDIKASDDPRRQAVATNADNYVVTVNISPSLPPSVQWGDATGGRGPRYIPWTIKQLPVEVPDVRANFLRKGGIPYFTFGNESRDDIEEKVAVMSEGSWLFDGKETCSVSNRTSGLILPYCTLADHKKTDAGNYWFTATLVKETGWAGQDVTNFIWLAQTSGGTRMDSQRRSWSIAQAENEVLTLSLASWQEGTTAQKPASTWMWSKATARYTNPDVVKYQWRPEGGGEDDWSEAKATFDPPTEYGPYELRAVICKDSNHEPGNWCEAEKSLRFYLWRHPSKLLSDYVDITATAPSGTLYDFPVLVRLKEPVRDGAGKITSGLPGFTYERAGLTGLELRFVRLSADTEYSKVDSVRDKAKDVLLPYEIDTWKVGGESLVWVKLPRLGSSNNYRKFRMYWHRRDDAVIKADILKTETWDQYYVGVWHLNEAEGPYKNILANSTAIGQALDAQGTVTMLTEQSGGKPRLGNAVLAKGNVMVPDYQPYLSATSPFTMTGWYRGDKYETGGNAKTVGRNTYLFTGKKTPLQYDENTGWGLAIKNDNSYKIINPYANNSSFGDKNVNSDVRSNWHQLVFQMPASGSSQTGTFYFDGGNASTSANKTMSTNALDYILVGATCAADEVRISKTVRDGVWIKAEYDTINNANYCTFGLVNRGLSESSCVWINYWTTEPSLKQYWEINELTSAKVTAAKGALKAGAVVVYYKSMPDGAEVSFPDASKPGIYQAEFTMSSITNGPSPYTGPHQLYDGSRIKDLEIVTHDPRPIDPDGEKGATLSGRILLANDDTTESGPVGVQSYWRTDAATLNPYWEHAGSPSPAALGGLNLRSGSDHTLSAIFDGGRTTNTLWKLTDVFIGNMMTNDDSLATANNVALSNRWNTLPWSSTSKPISSQAKWSEEGPLTNRSEVGQLIMRNAVNASVESQVYTNGIGTIYFDVVNAYALTDVNGENYKLVVEVGPTNDFGETNWERVEMTPLYVNGTSVTKKDATEFLDCLSVKNGGKVTSFQFYRVYAEVKRQEPLRFRIRRTTALERRPTPEEDPVADPNEPDGFIVLDNIIASWPAPVPKLEAVGTYDKTLSGKQVLGMEGAFSTTGYLKPGDTFGAAARLTGAGTNTVSAARIHYRWRYLNSHFDPPMEGGVGKWRELYLNLTNTTVATYGPLEYRNAVGDIEYYFDLTTFAPYYSYVDYSGRGLASKTETYTREEPPQNIPSSSTFGDYPSGGTNWFVRLRAGESDVRHMVLKIEGQKDVDMELLSDHVWRGYHKTLDGVKGGIRYRVEPRVWAKPGDLSVAVVTNRWYAKDDAKVLPTSAILQTDGDTNSWARVPCDGYTGYLMFQVDDRTKSCSVVHADFQDFNRWDDAKSDGTFTGNSTEPGKQTGVSPKKQDFDEQFLYHRNPVDPLIPWTDTPSASTNWTESLQSAASQEYADYVSFGSSTTLGGWTVGPGMYVYTWYKYGTEIPSKTGYIQRALQLKGCGEGWVQFPTTLSDTYAPRGIGTISCKARLAQFIDPFDDASYADPYDGDTVVNANYVFMTLAAFDLNSNKGFSGDASLSLFAYYHDRRGVYEVRLEQMGANVTGSTVTGPSGLRRLSLYRWKANKTTGTMTATRLGYQDYNITAVATAGETGYYTPFFISCYNESNATVIRFGVYYHENWKYTGFKYDQAITDLNKSSIKYYGCMYRDTSADRLRSGTYGVLSANCDGVFHRPHVSHEGLASSRTEKDRLVNDLNNTSLVFPTFYSCEDDIRDLEGIEPWITTYGRMETFWKSSDIWGLRACQPSQKLSVKVASRGSKNPKWETVQTFALDSFGAAGKAGAECAVRLDRPQDYDVRFEVGGTGDDPRTDVVVDDLAVTQWRGCDYGDHDTLDFVQTDDGYGWRTNFVFSSGWVTDKSVMLSAKRTTGWTTGSKVSGIRSPLMDGAGNPQRGIGLGVIAFEYRNAQANAKLQVQIATNGVSSSSAKDWAKVDDAKWTTVTNVDFSVMTERQRLGGKVDVYLGIHGVKGMMRICVDPSVVEEVAPTTWLDESKYGEVEITHVYCRDEPALDYTAWTGWNMLTTDNPQRQFLTDNLLYGAANGLSLGLNRSTDEDVEDDPETYRRQMPYVQTPVFVSNTVGEVTFRARKYELDEATQNAELVLYGGEYLPGTKDLIWHCAYNEEPLARFVVSNTTFTTFSYKTKPGEGYKAFRLGVAGIKAVDAETRGKGPTQGVKPVRVVVDEVMVCEAIRPRVGFRSIWPIRSAMMSTAAVPSVGTREEQPILGDAWSVQAEIEVKLLPDELDLTTPGREPRVIFHWFPGESPWGYTRWKGLTKDDGHEQAELGLAEGETMVFRGNYLKAPGAVVMAESPSSTRSYRIYQFAAEVVYYDKNGNCITGALEQAEWERPEWYAPLDLNATNGKGATFAAYNILERVSPGRAWINEANVFDGRDASYEYPAANNQYVEVAVPYAQSLDGWRLNYVDTGLATNLLCVFGQDGVAETKTVNMASNYTFITVQSILTKKSATLDPAKGEVDGTWQKFDATDTKAELDQTHPIALQLIRPSGIIAQEIVLEGTNTWAGTAYEDRYSAEERVKKLNASDPEKQWYLAGDEWRGTTGTLLTKSLGVTNVDVTAERASEVVPTGVWTKDKEKTPGRINVGQVIPENYAIYPSGDMVIVNATVEGAYISQSVGGEKRTVKSVMVATKKEGDGTNIVYHIDSPWYEIKEITENGVVKATGGRDGFVYAAGKGSSESLITVKATACPRRDLAEKYGLTADNRYSAAVLKWLEGGKTMKGDFAHPGEIDLPEYRDINDNFVTNLTLTETYWFDIDPTGSNWCYRAGSCGDPYAYEYQVGTLTKTNVRLEVFMVITNRSESGEQAGLNWSPYTLRGLVPGTDSQQYARGETNSWESVNFKMTGDMLDGLPLRARWVPLRYFIFTEGSFDAAHRSVIDIPHPFSPDSLSVNYGWHKYKDTYKGGFGYKWSIDSRTAPVAIETLAPTNAITW